MHEQLPLPVLNCHRFLLEDVTGNPTSVTHYSILRDGFLRKGPWRQGCKEISNRLLYCRYKSELYEQIMFLEAFYNLVGCPLILRLSTNFVAIHLFFKRVAFLFWIPLV